MAAKITSMSADARREDQFDEVLLGEIFDRIKEVHSLIEDKKLQSAYIPAHI